MSYSAGVVQRAAKVLLIGWLALRLGASVALGDGPSADAPTAPAAQSAKPDTFAQPKSLAELLALPPEQLDRVDIAVIDLLCAEGLRGSEGLEVQQCLDTLDTWSRYVESETRRNQHLFDEHPERFKNSLAYYRMAMLATVLCQDLRMRYNPEREKQLENGHKFRSDDDEKEFFGDSRDVFIHGIIGEKHYGTCASMPFLYVAIARRLGYPVMLSTTATPFYVRYEEGDGKHLNVEATEHRAFLTPSDDEYKNPWELHASEDEVNGMRYLRPLSNQEILGHSLLTRAAVLRGMKQYDKQTEAWATAARYLPDTPMWKGIERDMQALAKNEGEQARRNAMWNEIARLHIPRGAGYAYFQDKKVRLHLAMNHSRDTTAIEKAVKDLENELRGYVTPFIEPGGGGGMQLFGGPDRQLVLRYSTVSGKEVTIPADFLPPFDRRIIPPEVCERIAGKKLEDEESILAEFWAFYDEAAQSRQRAAQTAASQRAIQDGAGTGPILIARERVPLEFWNAIPQTLRARLSGLRDDQKIAAEMWAFHAEQEAKLQQEAQTARVLAMNRAMEIMRRAGIHPNPTAPRPQALQQPATPGTQQDPPYRVPAIYQEWITPEIASRLTPTDLWLLQQEERDSEARELAREQVTPGVSQAEPMTFQLVPASILKAGPEQTAHPPQTPPPLTHGEKTPGGSE